MMSPGLMIAAFVCAGGLVLFTEGDVEPVVDELAARDKRRPWAE